MKTKTLLPTLVVGAAYCICAPSVASADVTGAVENQDIYVTPAAPNQQPVLHNDVRYRVYNTSYASTSVNMNNDMLGKPTAPNFSYQP